MDADVKAKQMQARRAELLFKLKQSEIGAAGVTPQPLGGQVDFLIFPWDALSILLLPVLQLLAGSIKV